MISIIILIYVPTGVAAQKETCWTLANFRALIFFLHKKKSLFNVTLDASSSIACSLLSRIIRGADLFSIISKLTRIHLLRMFAARFPLNWRKTDMLSLENRATCYVEIYCPECKSNFPRLRIEGEIINIISMLC